MSLWKAEVIGFVKNFLLKHYYMISNTFGCGDALMEAHISWNTYVETVLEITVSYWPFSVQSQHLTKQNFNDFRA